MKLNKKGFTLVELLAVIVVLALLMVVAASSIGNALNNAKASAMETEAKKIVAKTYEDLKMQEVNPNFDYTYKNVNTSTGATDGDYTIILGINDGEIGTFCISDKSGKITYGTVENGSTIKAEKDNSYIDGECTLTTTNSTNTATKKSS